MVTTPSQSGERFDKDTFRLLHEHMPRANPSSDNGFWETWKRLHAMRFGRNKKSQTPSDCFSYIACYSHVPSYSTQRNEGQLAPRQDGSEQLDFQEKGTKVTTWDAFLYCTIEIWMRQCHVQRSFFSYNMFSLARANHAPTHCKTRRCFSLFETTSIKRILKVERPSHVSMQSQLVARSSTSGQPFGEGFAWYYIFLVLWWTHSIEMMLEGPIR